MKQRGEWPGRGRAEDNQLHSTAESVLAETAWTTLKEEEHKEQGKRERAATYKTSRLVVPSRFGNSLMSVAPLSDLQRNEDDVRWTEDPQLSKVPDPSAWWQICFPHPNGVVRGPRCPCHQRVPAGWAGERTSHAAQMELGISMEGDLPSSAPSPTTDILGTISTQIKEKIPNNCHGGCKQDIPPKPPESVRLELKSAWVFEGFVIFP